MNKVGQFLRTAAKLTTSVSQIKGHSVQTYKYQASKINYSFVKILKDAGKQEIIDSDKLIQALEESLISISDPQQGLENVNNLIRLKQQKHNDNAQYSNYEQDIFTKANVYYSLRDYQECMKLIEEVLVSPTASKEIKTRTLILKSSLIQHVDNDYEESLYIAQEAEKIIQDVNNSIGKELKVIIYHMIGEMQSSIFDNRNIGKKYLEQAIDIINDEMENNYMLSDKEKGQYMQRLANCYDSIAEIYNQDNKYDDCKQIMGKCIELWKNNQFKQPFQYANSLLRQGKISIDRGEYTQATEKLTRAMKLMQGYENTDQFIVLCINASLAHRGSNKFDKSLEILKEARSQLHHLNDNQRNYYTNQILEELVDVYLNQGQYNEAREALKEFKSLGESDYLKYIIQKQEFVITLCEDNYVEVINQSDNLIKLTQSLFGETSKEVAEILTSKGISFIHLNKPEEGFKYIQQSANILQDLHSIDEVQEVWNQVVTILQEQNNYKYVAKALGFLRRSIQIFVEQSSGEAGVMLDYIDEQIKIAKSKVQ